MAGGAARRADGGPEQRSISRSSSSRCSCDATDGGSSCNAGTGDEPSDGSADPASSKRAGTAFSVGGAGAASSKRGASAVTNGDAGGGASSEGPATAAASIAASCMISILTTHSGVGRSSSSRNLRYYLTMRIRDAMHARACQMHADAHARDGRVLLIRETLAHCWCRDIMYVCTVSAVSQAVRTIAGNNSHEQREELRTGALAGCLSFRCSYSTAATRSRFFCEKRRRVVACSRFRLCAPLLGTFSMDHVEVS